MTARAMDFNCDLGESYGWWVRGADEVMMTCISSANVACGFHAGDATVMRATVARALEHGVAIGAHPGYPDLLGFGRRALDVSPADTRNYVLYQLRALNGFVLAARRGSARQAAWRAVHGHSRRRPHRPGSGGGGGGVR